MKLFNFKKKIANPTHARCPVCQKINSIEEWDRLTQGFFMEEIPSVKNAQKTMIPFQCPSCYSGIKVKDVHFINANDIRRR